MLKKVLFFVLAVFMLQSVCFASEAEPTSVTPFYDGNRDMIWCSSHGGIEYYVDRQSVEVELCDPPEYIISVDIIEVDTNEINNYKIRGSKTRKFYYDEENEKMYLYLPWTDEWVYQRFAAHWEKDARFTKAGEIAFYLAFDSAFYGSTKTLSGFVDHPTGEITLHSSHG